MIKSANEFKEKVESIILPGSSIAAYSIPDVNNNEIIANTITDAFYNGIKNRKNEHIINDIAFYGTSNDWGYRQIFYSTIPEIIVAIPEVLTAYNKKTYYLGNFKSLDIRKHPFHERDNGNITKLWFYNYMNHVIALPSEFILGAVIYDEITRESSFIVNPNYIGLKEEKEQTKIASDIFKEYPKALTDTGTRKINWDTVESDYDKICQELEMTHDSKNAFYLKQYKEYLENKYHFLYRKGK